MISKIINKLLRMYYHSSSDKFCNYLKSKGIQIGGGNSFRPKTTKIDLTRPSLISIGSNCYFNEHFCILIHDWVTHVFLHSGREFCQVVEE